MVGRVSDLVEDVRRVLQAGPPLRLAVLFGSFARQRARADSDLDIAILPRDESLSLHAELDLAAQLSLATRREVDLVRLDQATMLLRWEVAKDGILLIADPMMILKQRGLAMTDEQQRQIVTCTDLATLDGWLNRAISVTSVDELLA